MKNLNKFFKIYIIYTILLNIKYVDTNIVKYNIKSHNIYIYYYGIVIIVMETYFMILTANGSSNDYF